MVCVRSWSLWLVGVVAVVVGCNDSFVSEDDGGIRHDGFQDTDGADPDAGDTGVIPGDRNMLLLRGTVVTPDEVIDPGEVLTHGDTLVCVASSCSGETGAEKATVVDTGGIIFPGLIDAHNHTQYNYLPLWQHQPKMYTNHNQWQASSAYSDFTSLHRQMEDTLLCEMIKYGEIRSLVAGTTSIQGTALRRCADTLIRNVDLPYNGLESGDTMRTNILGVSQIDTAEAQKLLEDFASGEVRSYVIHLAEGIDETARKEFDSLEELGLLKPQVVVIHGTALGQAELTKMSQAQMPLIWSPSSNIDLYGDTNDIAMAWQLGLQLALSPDWTPSGEPNIIDELSFAAQYNDAQLGKMWSAKDLVRMVTSKAAAVIKLDDEIGALKPGLRADLMVLAGDRAKPYEALINAKLSQVLLTVVGGRALYGEPKLMTGLEPNTYCETTQICGRSKVICVKESESDTDKLNQSLGDIVTALEGAYSPGILGLSTCP